MSFIIRLGQHLHDALKLPRLKRVSGASRSRPASWKLQHLVSVSRLRQNFEGLHLGDMGLISVSAQKVLCTSLLLGTTTAIAAVFDTTKLLLLILLLLYCYLCICPGQLRGGSDTDARLSAVSGSSTSHY